VILCLSRRKKTQKPTSTRGLRKPKFHSGAFREIFLFVYNPDLTAIELQPRRKFTRQNQSPRAGFKTPDFETGSKDQWTRSITGRLFYRPHKTHLASFLRRRLLSENFKNSNRNTKNFLCQEKKFSFEPAPKPARFWRAKAPEPQPADQRGDKTVFNWNSLNR
jgi:hypothetical protein